jgi:predicted regulator of Ras-like GTPase activity (Roadblock/LC7/MglB family)
MFRDSIQKMIERLDPKGGAAGVLMGFDGIPVDSYVRSGGASPDVPTIGAELAHLLAQIRRSLGAVGIGALGDLTLRTDRLAVLIEILSDGYFLALGLPADANLGKARYLLRILGPEVRAQM